MGVAVLYTLSGVVLYLMARASLYGEFDRSLATEARALSVLVEQEGDDLDTDLGEGAVQALAGAERSQSFELWRSGGEVLARSASLAGADLPRLDDVPLGTVAIRAARLPDGEPGRIATYAFHPRREEEPEAAPLGAVLAVARATAPVEARLAQLRALLFATGLAGLLAGAGVLAWIGRFGLRPVARLAGQIERMGEDDLSVRLDAAGAPVELAPVVDRLNGLLERLEAAFARERELAAEVAHELRTPLAGLKVTLELALDRERDPERYREAMRECLAICDQTHRMVEALLSLARLEAGLLEVEREPVYVAQLLDDALRQFEARAAARSLRIVRALDVERPVISDREKLGVILQNLLDNAVSYADEGGSIQVGVAGEGEETTIRVANSGSRLDRVQAQRAFERFWRGDAARPSGEHAGLGLPLCRKLVALLGGSIAIDATRGGTFSVTVTLR